MKFALPIIASALLAVSAPVFAMSHGGAKMDDTKKVDCKDPKNKDKKECQPAPKK